MVKLRKSHNKLKIILCSVLGAIVAVGGVLGIWKLSTTLSGDKVIDAPDNTVSVRKELPSGATYTQLHSDGLDTLGYLAYVLDRQEYYHSVANTVSTALIATQYTNSFKDYKDGIMLSSDFTYGFTGAGTQSCFVPDGNANGEGAGVYMRTSSGSVNGSTTGTGANWNDDVVYYDKEGYLYKYGQYSTEMTVYILNEETVLSWDDVVENGDGTYSQTFYLDAEKAAYYYQYAMQTRGGLDTLPEFESITLTFTFDDNYRVLRIDATEVSEITYIFSMSSTSQTTTTYSYEQENFDEAHYDYFDSYYSQYVGQLETGGGDEPELDALTLLGTAFADVVNGTGDQFDATVTLGDSVYYGRIYLNVPMSAFSSSDVIGALDVRLALSADSLFDSQDLYIQLKDGEVSGYYSSDFALKVNINDFSQLISKFENWVSSLGGSSDAEVLAETSSDSGFSLEDILNGLVLTEREGGATIALNLDDLFGIGLSAELNFTSSEGENGTTYAFANASVGNISYNGSPISLSLALTPSSAETISHEESDSPFDLTVAANSLYELLNSETISAQLTLEGDKLADVLANYNLADLGGSIDDLRLEITGSVDINGVTVGAQARIYRVGDNSDVLNADVYYEIDPSAGDYGTAYLNIKNILGAECDVKAYSNVSELVSAIEKIIARFGSEGGSAEVSALAEDSATDIAALINDILSLDFGSIIKEVQGNGTVIGATLNVDSVLAVLLGDVSVGDITLEYHLGDFEAENYNQNGGWLYGSLPSLGIEAYAYGSTASLTQPEKDEYLDINDLINSVLDLLNSNTVKVGLDLEGDSLAAVLNANGITGYDSVLNGATLNVTGYASIKNTAAKADITLKNTKNTIFAASVYYAYTEGTYGIAYLNITNILGKSFTDLKVYCNISEIATMIEGLLGSGVATLSETTEPETNEIADIISQVLNINFGAMVKELAANASGLTATADLDEILGEFAGVDLSLGTVTLNYNITSNTLSGEALNGGLDIIVSGDEMTISEPEDKDTYLDANKLLNSVLDLLNSNTVKVGLDLEGESLAAVLNANGITGYESVLSGATLNVTGYASIKDTVAKADITLKNTEKTIFAASVYYAYTDDGTYGVAYLNITNILGKSFSDLKVYCDISEIVTTIEGLLGSGVAELDETTEPETNEIADIISQVLNINFGAMVKELAANASGLTATADLDEILGEFAGVDLSLGTVTLNYNITSNTLSGEALNGGLDIIVSGDEMTISEPEDKDTYLDANKLLNSVLDLLNSNTVKVGLDLEGESLAAVLNANGITGYDSVLSGATLNVTGYASIKNTAAKADITLKNTEKTIFAASVYYAYAEGTYGVAYLNITNILGKAFTDLKVYCNISEIAATIQNLLGSGVATLSETADGETNEIADIISQVLNINFGAMVKELAANASGLTATADLDEILGEFAGVDLGLGTVTLNYNITSNTLSGEALNGGLDIAVSGDEMTISEPADKADYLDANKLLNSVLYLLNSNTVKVGLDLEGDSLAAVLNANGITGYESVLSGATLNVTGYASIKDTVAKADITLKNTEKTIFAASVYYAYTDDGTYGVAYLNITNILGKSFSDLKVYCDISEIVTTIEGLLGSGAATLSETTEPETNEIADIISQVLNINFGAMVKELAANASGLTATADLDEILGEFAGVDLSLGTVTLNYNITSNTLSGEALNGGLDIIVSGDEMTISEPEDKDTYLDANKLLNSVLDLLNKNTVTVDLEIKGAAVADILGKANIADIGAAIDGLTLKVNGGVSIDDLAAAINLTLVGNDSATNEEKVYLDADIYYDYDDSGNSDGENYGTAYISINELLGVSFVEENTASDENTVSKVKVYADIAAAKNNVEALIEQITQIIEGALTPAQADYAVSTYSEDGENAVAGIIARVLGIDFTEFVSEMRTSADGFTATADIDYILSYFSVGEYGLGDVTLTYSIKDGTLIGSARQDGEDADWLKVTVGGKDKELVPPDESAYLDVNELVNSVRNLLASNTVALDIDLTGDKLAELLIANGVSSDYADLLMGLTLEIDGRASIADLAAEVSVKLYGGDTTYLEMSAFYNYDPKAADDSGVVPSNYGEVYVNISKLLGNDSAIKVYCDITEAVESINTLLSEAAQADAATLSESSGNALDLGDIQSIIEGVLTFDLTSLIGELSADAKGLTVTLNADELIGLFFDGSTVKVGTVTLTYNINNEEGAAVGTLSGSALGGGLKITVNGDTNPLNAPKKDGYLNINTVLDLINKAKAAAQEIIDSRSVYFALGDGANAGAEVEVNGINVGISGTGEVKWDENGTVTNLALDIKLWIANGASNKSTTTVKLIYNNAVADDEPFVTLAINNVGIKITQNDIAQMGNDVNNLIANVTALINALTGNSDGNGGNNGEITQQLLTALAEASGESTATAPDGNNTPADTDYLAIVKLVLGLLGGDDDTVGGSLGNVLEEALSSLLSGSSVSVDELGDSLKLILAGAADITLGVNDGALTLAGNISDIANLDISVSAGKFTNGAGTVASALEEQFNATTESGAVYTFYSASESGSFSKVIYDFVLGAFDSIDIGSFLGGKTYQVTFSLAGDASGIEALSGVSVNATLYFGNGITNGELDKGKLLEADIDLSIDGFTFKANLFYNNRNFYISVSNIGGTSLSGLNVKVSADDIYAAAENIVALINNPNILALFTGADGEGAADIIGDGEGAENVSLISDETSSSLTDVIAAILGMKLSDVITISNSGTETLVTADIDKVLSEFGISQKVGPAQLVVDSGDSKKIALYLGNKDSEYNWLKLVSELATDYNGSADSANLSSYIDIGFIDELISDLSKFITSNADSGDNGNISTLFSLTGGTITVKVDLSKAASIPSWVANISDITIDKLNIVLGLDESGELYLSMKGNMSAITARILGIPTDVATAHEIGVTYSNGKITLSRYSGDSREYWIMTPEFFIDNMFAKNENGNDSPIRWLCNIDYSIIGYDIWNDILLSALGDLVSDISSGTSQPDEVYLYNLYHTNPVAATFSSFGYEMPSMLANYLLGFETTAGGGVTVGNTEGVLENVEKPELADYYAISLNASALTGNILDVLDIAISRSDKNGFGGIYAFASIQSRLLTVNFDIGYNGYDGDVFDSANDKYVPDYYAEAVAKAGGEDKIDFAYSEALKENDVYYADRVFGGVQISADGTVGTIMPQTVYKNDALTITVYESEDDYNNKVNAQTMQVKYKSTIYLHSASGVMVDEEGNTYIFVQVTEDGSIVTESDGTYPETAAEITSNATFYKMKIDDEKYRAMNVTVHNTANGSDDSVTLTVYSGTSLTEIAQRAFGGYTVLGDKWQTLGEDGVMVDYAPTDGNVTIPEEHEGGIYSIDLYAQFVRSEVTINGVVYEFVQNDTELGGHYEISGYTSSLAVYYGAGSVLVLENEIDGYPVTTIRSEAFKMDSVGDDKYPNSLQNVVVPSNITTVGGRAFGDNKNLKTVVFLADSVHFNIDISDTDWQIKDSQKYAFYGCTSLKSADGSYDDSITNLKIYAKNITTAGNGDSPFSWNNGVGVVNRKDGNTYTRAQIYVESAWSYLTINYETDIDSNIVSGLYSALEKYITETYSYNQTIFNTTGGVLISFNGSFTDKNIMSTGAPEKEEFEKAIKDFVDSYFNGSTEQDGVIGLYSTEVVLSGDLSGSVTLTVKIAESNEEWYQVPDEYTVTLNGEPNSDIKPIFTYDRTMLFNDKTYALSGITVTVTLNLQDAQNYTIVSVNGQSGSDFIFGNEIEIIAVECEVREASYIVVSSYGVDLSYSYNDEFVSATQIGESNLYAIPDYAIKYGVLPEIKATDNNSGYYFLGWATYADSSYEFNSANVDTKDYVLESNLNADIVPEYYAVWADSSRELKVESYPTSGLALPAVSVVGDDSEFYKWYSDETFVNEIVADESGKFNISSSAIVYARMKFTLTVQTIRGKDNDSRVYFEGEYQTANIQGNEWYELSSSEGDYSKTFKFIVLEGVTVNITTSVQNGVLTTTLNLGYNNFEYHFTSSKKEWSWSSWSNVYNMQDYLNNICWKAASTDDTYYDIGSESNNFNSGNNANISAIIGGDVVTGNSFVKLSW